MLSPCCQFHICSLWKRSSNWISFCSSQHAPPSPSSYIGQAAQRKRKMDRTAWRESNILNNHTQQQVIQVMDHYGCDIKIQYTSPQKNSQITLAILNSFQNFYSVSKCLDSAAGAGSIDELLWSERDKHYKHMNTRIFVAFIPSHLGNWSYPTIWIAGSILAEFPLRHTTIWLFFLLTIPSKRHHSFWLGFKSLPQSTIGVDKAYSGNGNWSFHMMVLCDVVF